MRLFACVPHMAGLSRQGTAVFSVIPNRGITDAIILGASTGAPRKGLPHLKEHLTCIDYSSTKRTSVLGKVCSASKSKLWIRVELCAVVKTSIYVGTRLPICSRSEHRRCQ